MKKVIVLVMTVMVMLVGCMEVEPESSAPVKNTTEPVVETTGTDDWKDNFPADLANEIETAFSEIGENPDNIVSVEYVDTHTSGYIFERKCYKVEFSYSFGNPGWKHARNYLITTQNYFDGEPEKEQYPDEFLVTIKFWAGDDGHWTNINQWTWTGNGEKQ